MVDNDKPKRVDLGFSGGQALPLRMRDAEHAELRRALEGERRGWHIVRTEDSEVAVDLAQIVYVRLDTEQHRVGF
jgi:hypothetical protein